MSEDNLVVGELVERESEEEGEAGVGEEERLEGDLGRGGDQNEVDLSDGWGRGSGRGWCWELIEVVWEEGGERDGERDAVRGEEGR